ncbi:MAG: DegT/DnrJ/EryC1/StrS family aminotransferase, partial [Victivallaceae bacterium]
RDWGRDCWCDSGVDNTCRNRFSRQFGQLPLGYDHKYVYSHFGYNLKVSDMQAAVGCAQLDKIASFVEKRKANFARLYQGLKDCPELRLFEKYPESDPSWFGFLITLAPDAGFSRNDLVKHLEDKKIQTRNLFAGNLVKHPCFESLRPGIDYRVAGELTNTDRIMNDAFWIGLYPGMSAQKLDYMIEVIKGFLHGDKP